MYPVDPNFDNVLRTYHPLLRDFVLRLKHQNRYKGVPTSDLQAMIEWAAWKAWLTQKRQAEANKGMSPYKYGTYLTIWVKEASNQYSDVGFCPTEPCQISQAILADGLETVDVNDFIHVNIRTLSEREQTVLHGLYFQDKTLREMGEAMNLSHEMVRQIQKTALDKIHARNN